MLWPDGGGGLSSCLVYCFAPIGWNLANFEIFTGGLPDTAEKICIFDTSVQVQNGGRVCHTATGAKHFSTLFPNKHLNINLKIQ